MFLKVLRSKIHRATVTEASVDYEGSIAIDQALLDAAGLIVGQCVLVADLANGARFETYVISAAPGSGTICVNGAAARLVSVGDLVIIMAFAYVPADEVPAAGPSIVLVDARNRIKNRP